MDKGVIFTSLIVKSGPKQIVKFSGCEPLFLSRDSSHGSSLWLGRLVVRVLVWSSRGPGFESKPGHKLFLT